MMALRIMAMAIINVVNGGDTNNNGGDLLSGKGHFWWGNNSEVETRTASSNTNASGAATVTSFGNDESSFTGFLALVAILMSFSILGNVAVVLATIFRSV